MIPDKLFVPSKTDSEKLQSLDSCIESCLKMIAQDLKKRKLLQPSSDIYIVNNMIDDLGSIIKDFEILNDKS
jgi:hypothetical protein